MARVPLRGTTLVMFFYPQSALRLDWGYSLVYLFEAPRPMDCPTPLISLLSAEFRRNLDGI